MVPGSVTFVGAPKQQHVIITAFDYNADSFTETVVDNVSALFPLIERDSVTWINVDGLHEPEVIKQLGNHFNIHPLIQEDIIHPVQRPKFEDFDGHIYLVLKSLVYRERECTIDSEQISILMFKNCVITFQEKTSKVFDPVKERLRNNKGRIRRVGSDYLVYSLMDAVIDNYFIILDRVGDVIDDLEEGLIHKPDQRRLATIHRMKREMLFLRKSVWPLREVINGMQKNGSSLIHQETIIYFQDIYDHTIQVIDTIESLRDIVLGMLDTYLSSLSNRMGEIMKVLTGIATIFMPLSFLAGVYGMNFDYIPGKEWKYGFFALLFFMAVIALLMFTFFKRRRWF
jgi:magnesium transporter